MKSEHLSQDMVTDYFLGLFKQFESSASWMHDIFRQDDLDFIGVHPSLKSNKNDTYRDWVSNVYGLGNTKTSDWKDYSNVGALKLRSKYNALVAHLMQDVVKDGQITGSLKHTKESDIEELINKGELDVEALGVPEEQINKLVEDSNKALKKAEQILLDNKQEGNTEELYYQSIRDLCRYGVCALENGIRVDKKIRSYAPQIIQSPEGDSLSLVPTPSFKDSFVLTSKRISPFNILLDPEAEGDPQRGIGCFKREKIDANEISRLMKLPYYDSSVLKDMLDEYNLSTEKNTEGSDDISDPTTVSKTKPFMAITFWGNVSRFNLELWKKDNLLVKNLVKELKASSDVDYSDKYAEFKIQAILIDDKLVYLSPLLTADMQRPVSYGRMIPVEGTNYAMGVFALGREPSRAMTKIWNRAYNNETMVGSAMFGYDPKMVDGSTLIFKPGGMIKLKPASSMVKGNGANNGGIHQYKFESVSQALLVLFDKLDMMLDELTMIPRNLIGVSDTSRRTATEVTQNLSSAQVILLSIRRNFDRDVIAKDLSHTYHYLQNDKSTPKDALADAFVEVYGAETFALKVINKQMVQELLQIIPSLAQVAPDLISSFNWPELTSNILEGLGFDKSKFMNTPELKGQLDQANQQLQQMSQQLEQAQQQIEKCGQEAEKLSQENEDLILKNHQISSQGKVEARLNLEQMQTKQLQDEIKRLKEDMAKMKSECAKDNKEKTNESGK